ncbi:MAG: hypothetical protein ACXWU2_05255 [Allosphingosinicella sp.]
MPGPALLLAMLATVAAADQAVPEEIPFAQATFDGWRAEAITDVEVRAFAGSKRPLPVVGEIRCTVSRDGLSVHINRRGAFSIFFAAGETQTDADRPLYGDQQIRSLRLGRTDYDVTSVQTLYFPWRFRDVSYPGDDGTDTLLPIFQGHVAVRRGREAPWLHITSLLDDLIEARSVRIGYGEEIDGRVPAIHYLTVPLTGLGPALSWCEQQLESDNAYRLRP